MTGYVTQESRGAVALITVCDHERRNALTPELSAELAGAIAAAEADPHTHAVVVTGAEPAFCAGADLSALSTADEPGLRSIYEGFLALARCSLPTVAAVAGPAVGAGLNLALAADVRIAGGRARFDPRFLDLGIHPGGGMTWMLQRLLGPQRTVAMTLFGQVHDAGSALEAGLVLRTVDGDREAVLDAALALAEGAGRAPRELLRSTKRTMTITRGLDEHARAVDVEISPQLVSLASPEVAERLSSRSRRG